MREDVALVQAEHGLSEGTAARCWTWNVGAAAMNRGRIGTRNCARIWLCWLGRSLAMAIVGCMRCSLARVRR